ncbi:MAG: ArsC family reductase [Pseudomonadales bacterium]|jgi:arsenate reductase|nr:ArsC family reductase [Pseudomonadales bacterium]
MTPTLYGIPNCSTVKKARAWLAEHELPYSFHDYKKAGVDAATLKRWANSVGMQNLINTKGTTWRKLDEAQRAKLTDAKALKLMQEYPSLICRPVLESNKLLLIGFDEQRWGRFAPAPAATS